MSGQPTAQPDDAPERGSRVRLTDHNGPAGVVVGPDRQFSPQPRAVFVQFDTGSTRLVDVVDLTATHPQDTAGE